MTNKPDAHGQARRRLLLTLAATGGAFAAANVLPRQWTRPIIDTIVVPAHAQATGPVLGLFTTSGPQASIFDLLVAPVHAAPAGGVTVGNASFDVAWDLVEDGYSFCASGVFFSGNGAPFVFLVNGLGARKGNALSDIDISANTETGNEVNGNLVVFNQTVDGSQLTFDTSFQSASTSGTAVPGGECGINSVTDLRMSSPYRDKDLA